MRSRMTKPLGPRRLIVFKYAASALAAVPHLDVAHVNGKGKGSRRVTDRGLIAHSLPPLLSHP